MEDETSKEIRIKYQYLGPFIAGLLCGGLLVYLLFSGGMYGLYYSRDGTVKMNKVTGKTWEKERVLGTEDYYWKPFVTNPNN